MIRFDEKLKGITSVGISGHVRPDGDSIGSALAVYNYLLNYDSSLDLHVFLQEIPSIFSFTNVAN